MVIKPEQDNEAPEREFAPLRVVVVDPLPIVTEGLGLFLDTQPDVELVATANTADDAIKMMAKVKGKTYITVLVAMELTGERDALWLIREIRERFPMALVIACGVNPTRTTVSRALFVGADGFIDKRSDPVEFIQGMRRAGDGEMILVGLPPDWMGSIAEDVQREQTSRPVLSDREREVLSLAASGLSAKGVGEKLRLSERTITTHLTNIYEKLGVHSRVAAITAAVRDGMITVEEQP